MVWLPACLRQGMAALADGWDGQSDLEEEYSPLPDPPHDMTQPLSAYFISAGHNSYLLGNQLISASGTDIIVWSLHRACRVIELDVYNAKPGFKDGPVCKHGGTLTRAVALTECLRAIRIHAFTASPYPLIITIEMHLDTENQVAMASILETILGGMLYIPAPEEVGALWHSPHELRHKILIRTAVREDTAPELKRLVYIPNTSFKSLTDANQSPRTSSSSFTETAAAELLKRSFKGSGLPRKPPGYHKDTRSNRTSGRTSVGDSGLAGRGSAVSTGLREGAGAHSPQLDRSIMESVFKEDKAAARRLRLIPERNPLAGHDAHSPAEDISMDVVQAVHSLGDVYTYSSRCLMRVYPGGHRVDSSNYNPCKAWSLGASIVALNWQTNDKPLWINNAMFLQQNEACGYLLKPPWMRALLPCGGQGPRPPIPVNPLPDRTPRQLEISLYSAYCRQSPYSCLCCKDDLFVQMYVYGMPVDWASQRTATKRNSDRSLINKKYDFAVHYPEMAVLVIVLWDEDTPVAQANDLLGHWEAPLATLRQGSFLIYLTDENGHQRMDRWIKLNIKWLIADPLEREASGLMSPGRSESGAVPLVASSTAPMRPSYPSPGEGRMSVTAPTDKNSRAWPVPGSQERESGGSGR